MHLRRLVPLWLLAIIAVACTANPTATPQPPATLTPVPIPPSPTAAPTQSSSGSGDTVKLVMVQGRNEARFRVREQLAGISLPSDAIGKTQEISGTIVGKTDGTIVSSQSKFRVDLRTLKSDRDQRDNFLRRNTLETDRYPYAEFVPTEAPGLPLRLPSSGQVAFKLIGDLTIRDVTKRVTWDAQGKVTGDEASGTASTTFTFAYFNLAQPRVPLVLSIENDIRLELDLYLKRQN